jgi:hypothetical protein
MEFVAHCKTELLRLIPWLTGNPPSATLMWTALFGGLLVFIVILRVSGSALGVQRNGWLIALVATVVIAAVLLAAETGMRHYVLPRLKLNLPPLAMVIAGAAGGLFLIAIPLMALLMRAGYLHALFMLIFSTAAAALTVILVNWGSEALKSGGVGVGQAREHRQDIEAVSE